MKCTQPLSQTKIEELEAALHIAKHNEYCTHNANVNLCKELAISQAREQVLRKFFSSVRTLTMHHGEVNGIASVTPQDLGSALEKVTPDWWKEDFTYQQPSEEWLPDVDWLSNVIRTVDGNNTLGAGLLAEKILEAITQHRKEIKWPT